MAVLTENKKATRRPGTVDTTRPPARRPLSTDHQPLITVLPHPRKSPGGLRRLPGAQTPLPMGQRGSVTTRAVKNLSARAPMLAASLTASVAVVVLCLYVTAYARVNAEGQKLSRLRQELKIAERREIDLKGEISRLQLSAPTRAQAMNMIPAPPEMVEILTDEASIPSGAPVK